MILENYTLHYTRLWICPSFGYIRFFVTLPPWIEEEMHTQCFLVIWSRYRPFDTGIGATFEVSRVIIRAWLQHKSAFESYSSLTYNNNWKSLVEKLFLMTILCHLDASFQTFASTWTCHSEHSCLIGPFSCHIGHFLSFRTVSQKIMFSTSESSPPFSQA